MPNINLFPNTEGNWFPDTATPLHPFRMRSSLRPHPKRCPTGTTWQSSIYRFWSDNATTARNLQSGTATWGGCYPHMQILHKGGCRPGSGLMHRRHLICAQETPTISGRLSFGRASTSQAWTRGIRWALTSLTPSCTTSVCRATCTTLNLRNHAPHHRPVPQRHDLRHRPQL